MTKASETSKLNNMMLKEWLYEAGSDRRGVLLTKFKFNLQRLGLSERKVYRGLLQLMSFPTVVLRPLQLNTAASTIETSRRIGKLRRKRRRKYLRLKLPSVSTDSGSDEFRCESHLKILDNNNVSKPETENRMEPEYRNSVVSHEGWGCERKNGEHVSTTRTEFEQAKDMDSSRCVSKENSTSVHLDESRSREINSEVKSSRETSHHFSLHKPNAEKAVGELRNESANGEEEKKTELVKIGDPSFAKRRSGHRRHKKRRREKSSGAESQKTEEVKRNEECRKSSTDRCKIITSEGHVVDSSEDTLMSPNSSGGSGSFQKSKNRRDTIESIDHRNRHRASSSRSPSSRSHKRKLKKIGENPNGIEWVLRGIEFLPLKKRSIMLFQRFQIARMKKEALEDKLRAFFGCDEDVENDGCSTSYVFGNMDDDSDQETIMTTQNTEDVQAILEQDYVDTGPIDACEWLAKEIKGHCGSGLGNQSSCDTSVSGVGATEAPDDGQFSIKENAACVIPDSSSSPGLQPTSQSESVGKDSPELNVPSIAEPTKRSLADDCDVQSKRIRCEASEAVNYDPSLLSESATRPEAPALSLAKSARATPDISSSVSEIASTVPNCSPHEPHSVSPSQDTLIIDSRSSIIERDDDARFEETVTSVNAEATIADIAETFQTPDIVSPVKFFEVAFQGNTYGLVEVEKTVVPPISANGDSAISQNCQQEGVSGNPISFTVGDVETTGLPLSSSHSNHPVPKETPVEVDCPRTSNSKPLSNTCIAPVTSPTVTPLAYCTNTPTVSNTMTISPTHPLTASTANRTAIPILCPNEATATTPEARTTWTSDVELMMPLDLSQPSRRNAYSSGTKDIKPDSSCKDGSSSSHKQCDGVQDFPAIELAAINRQQSNQHEQKSVQRIEQEQQQSNSLEHIHRQKQQRLQQQFSQNGQQLKGRDKPQSQTQVEKEQVQPLGEQPVQPRLGQGMRFQDEIQRYYQQGQQPRREQPTRNPISAETTKTAYMVNHGQRIVESVSVPVTKASGTAPVFSRLRVLQPWELGSTNWCPSPAPAVPVISEVTQRYFKYEHPMQNIFLCLVNKRRLIAHRKKVNNSDFSQNYQVELIRIQQEYETSLLVFRSAIEYIMQSLRSITQTVNFILSSLKKYTPAGVIQFTREEVTDAIRSSQKMLLQQPAFYFRGNVSLPNNSSDTNTHFGDVLMTKRQIQELRQQQLRYFEIFGYKPSSKNLIENLENQRSQHQCKQVPVIRSAASAHTATARTSPIETVHASRKQNILKLKNQTIQPPVTDSILNPVAQTVQKSVIQPTHKPAINPLRKPETHPAQKRGLENVERSDPDIESAQNSGTRLIQNPEIHSIQKPVVQPINEPVSQPVQIPETQSLQKPGSEPFQKPGTEPFQKPGTEPVQKPGTESVQKPGTEPFQKPGTAPFQKPGTESFQKPETEPFQKPGTEPFQKPGTKPFQKPGTEPSEKPGTKPFQKPQSPPDVERTAIQSILKRNQPSLRIATEDRTAPSKDPCEVTTTTVIGDINAVTEPTHVAHPSSTIDETAGKTSPNTTIDSLTLRELLTWNDPNLSADVPPRIVNPTRLGASEVAAATVQQTELETKDLARSHKAKRDTVPMIDLTDFDNCTELCDSSTDPAVLPSRQALQDDADKQPSVSFPSIAKVQTISEEEFADFDNAEAFHDDTPVELCLYCADVCTIACGRCAWAFYCSKECQERHWVTKHHCECIERPGIDCCD